MSSASDQSSNLPLGSLVRAGADGELTAEQQDRLDAACAADARVVECVESERRLRRCVCSCMCGTSSPKGLADRVARAVAADQAAGAALEDLASQTRRQTFWSSRVLTRALAAVLVLTLGAALVFKGFSISGQGLDSAQLAYQQEVASFITKEHGRCCGDRDAAKQKLKISDQAEAAAAVSAWIGHEVSLPCQNRRPDIRFDGAGPCGIPGKGKSAHVMYEPPNGPRISIFIKPDTGELPIEPGKTYVFDSKACGGAGVSVLAWVRDSVVYYAVFEKEPGCEAVWQELGIAPPTAHF